MVSTFDHNIFMFKAYLQVIVNAVKRRVSVLDIGNKYQIIKEEEGVEI